MRISRHISRWLAPAAAAGAIVLAACGPGYYTSAQASARFGTGIELYGYDPGYYGDWRVNYRQWSPVTVYEYNGQYYPSRVRGAREVQVYRTRTGYVLPPRDQEWSRTDRRFDSRKLPDERDYGRARPRPHQ